MENAINVTANKLDKWLVANTGISLLDYPDNVCFSDWIDDDITEKGIDDIIPDLAWEVLDLSGMNRDTVNKLCYPNEYGDDVDEV